LGKVPFKHVESKVYEKMFLGKKLIKRASLKSLFSIFFHVLAYAHIS